MRAISIDARQYSDRDYQFSQKENGLLSSDSIYDVKIASSPTEIISALRLRYEVFAEELKALSLNGSHLDLDEFDLRCKHLIVTERNSGRTIGTYRLNGISAGEASDKLYSYGEFTIENLPEAILRNGLEAGRACVAADHRGSKVLYLMWKALAKHLRSMGRRYIFGCCSIFTNDRSVGSAAYRQLLDSGHVCESFYVGPRQGAIPLDDDGSRSYDVQLPPLFEMYLKLGAKVCGPPTYDTEFRSVDFFVLFDLEQMNDRYRRRFLD